MLQFTIAVLKVICIGKFDKKIKKGKLKKMTFFIAYSVIVAFFSVSIQFSLTLPSFQKVLSTLPRNEENNTLDFAD